jgi:4-alpha-glucanotransferase
VLALNRLLPEYLIPSASGEADLPSDIDAEIVSAAHRYLARSPARLVAAQLEDMVGAVEQANLPGTVDEHPNWRRKLPVSLEELETHEGFARVAAALRDERPK